MNENHQIESVTADVEALKDDMEDATSLEATTPTAVNEQSQAEVSVEVTEEETNEEEVIEDSFSAVLDKIFSFEEVEIDEVNEFIDSLEVLVTTEDDEMLEEAYNLLAAYNHILMPFGTPVISSKVLDADAEEASDYSIASTMLQPVTADLLSTATESTQEYILMDNVIKGCNPVVDLAKLAKILMKFDELEDNTFLQNVVDMGLAITKAGESTIVSKVQM